MAIEKEDRVSDAELLRRYSSHIGTYPWVKLTAERAADQKKAGKIFDPIELAEREKLEENLTRWAPGLRDLLAKYGCYAALSLEGPDGALDPADPIELMFDEERGDLARKHLQRCIDNARSEAVLLLEKQEKALARALASASTPAPPAPEVTATKSVPKVPEPDLVCPVPGTGDKTADPKPVDDTVERDKAFAEMSNRVTSIARELDTLKRREARNEWLGPSTLLVLAGAAAAGLAYFVHSEIKSTLTTRENIELIDLQLRALRTQERDDEQAYGPKKQGQTQPNNAAHVTPTAAPSSASSAVP